FRKTQVSAGPPVVSRLEVVADNIQGWVERRVGFAGRACGGSLALLISEDGNKALQASLTSVTVTASGFASAAADSVTVKYNSDAANAVNIAGGLDIDGVHADLNVGAGVVSFKAINFRADFASFVHIQGDFAFRKTQVSAGPPVVSRLEVVADNIQ